MQRRIIIYFLANKFVSLIRPPFRTFAPQEPNVRPDDFARIIGRYASIIRAKSPVNSPLAGKKIEHTNLVINGIDIGINNGHNKNVRRFIRLEVFYARSQNGNITR